MTTGAWSDLQSAIDDVGMYWDYINNNYLIESTATVGHLRDFIQSEVGVQLEGNKLLIDSGLKPTKVIIQSVKLKNHLIGLQNEGKLDITPKSKDINQIMWTLGWKHTTKGWEER